MSEETNVGTTEGGATPPVTGSQAQEQPQQAAPKLLKVYGREFDVSTEQGMLQAQTWSEAMSTLVGKQSTEIGALRKFKSERDQVPKSYEEVLEKASELRDSGEHKAADRLMLNFTQEQKVAADRKLALERENDRTWETYFDSRPEVVKLFGKDKVRTVSEKALGILDDENPFKTLDDYWRPRVDMLVPKSSDPQAQPKPREETPPASLSGGPARPAPSAAPVAKSESIDDVLNAYHTKFSKR
jgi:hypothetical protein